MDTKAAFDREAFEAWVAEEIGHTVEYVKGQRAVSVDRYYNEYIEIPYRAWKASRAAIEIELDADCSHSDEYFCDGYRIATEAAKEAITSHGIRIKGKEE